MTPRQSASNVQQARAPTGPGVGIKLLEAIKESSMSSENDEGLLIVMTSARDNECHVLAHNRDWGRRCAYYYRRYLD